ncbi:hypothetical protein TL08_22695 [Actinoalloteichus hymeniacidonis]|uniref:Uncharacterized protein n=1 Tax=Actinoalloteichus hymeniacidonis TaxID=340345 RepID=A0AAC9HU04_9PSEU|nr:hypothetical protein TL08_22695 [Actinoalloteichus hymeniacidonis]
MKYPAATRRTRSLLPSAAPATVGPWTPQHRHPRFATWPIWPPPWHPSGRDTRMGRSRRKLGCNSRATRRRQRCRAGGHHNAARTSGDDRRLRARPRLEPLSAHRVGRPTRPGLAGGPAALIRHQQRGRARRTGLRRAAHDDHHRIRRLSAPLRTRLLGRPGHRTDVAALVRRPDELAFPNHGAADRATLRLEPIHDDPRRRWRRWQCARRDPARTSRTTWAGSGSRTDGGRSHATIHRVRARRPGPRGLRKLLRSAADGRRRLSALRHPA